MTNARQGELPLAPRAPSFGDRERPLTVEALVRVAALLLEEQLGMVWVEGEVSTLRAPGSGHVYFVLKDAGAQVPAVMWRSTAARLKFKLEEGKRFLVRAKPGIYPEQGKFQLYVEAAEPAGLGAWALALEQLKRKLAGEGLFDESRKRTLPPLPRRVGVVTSPTGAAVRDVIRVIQRRFPVPILISPTRVQGDGAAAEIAGAINRIGTRGIDVLIVGRGGGSTEDLSAFNEESVVRAIAACPVPVISAVGHEVDVTLADLVADVRASTPTAAGELAVPELTVLEDRLTKLEARLVREARLVLSSLRTELDRQAMRLGDPSRRLEHERQRLDELLAHAGQAVAAALSRRHRLLAEAERRLTLCHPRTRLLTNHRALVELRTRADAAIRRAVERRRRAFESMAARLDAMSPLRVLDRGYSIALTADGRVVAKADELALGDPLRIRLARGELDVRVESISGAK